MEFAGKLKISKDNWIESKVVGEPDIGMIESIVWGELYRWVNNGEWE